MFPINRQYLKFLFILTLLCNSASWAEALNGAIPGTIKADIRLRYESVDDDAKTKKASATTLRARLGYETEKYNGFQAYLEGQGNYGTGDYNSTLNNETSYPVVADPDKANIHQFYVSYEKLADSIFKVGRQEILWDNHRFLGNVGWRQLAQSFDAALVTNNSLENLTVSLGYISNVLDIRDQSHSMSSPIFRIGYEGCSHGKLALYGLLLDYDEAVNYSKSNSTMGARLSGDFSVADATKLIYTAEYAKQTDKGKSPVKYDTSYVLAELGVQHTFVSVLAGYEVLGADSTANVGFSTPLATLHKFQGWADKFLATPAAGVEDKYLSLSIAALPLDLKATIVAHDFNSNVGSTHYGTELDFSLSKPFKEGYLKDSTFTIKMAQYSADKLGTDTDKLIFEYSKRF